MKKRFVLVCLCLLMLLSLSGCGSRTALTAEEFIAKAETFGYETADITEQYASYGIFADAAVATSPDGFQVEFYVLNDEATAAGVFETNKADFDSLKGAGSTSTSVNLGNYSSYAVTSGGKYMYVSRVGSTLLYVSTESANKDAVKAIVKELGY